MDAAHKAIELSKSSKTTKEVSEETKSKSGESKDAMDVVEDVQESKNEVKATKRAAPKKKEKKKKINKKKTRDRRLKLRTNKRELLIGDIIREKKRVVDEVKAKEAAERAETEDSTEKENAVLDDDGEMPKANVRFLEPTSGDDEKVEDNIETKDNEKMDEEVTTEEPKSILKNKKKKTKKAKVVVPQEPKVDKHQEPSLEYLKTFCKNKDEWKFKKVLQMWILRHMWFNSKIDDKHFKYTLKYLKNLGDHAKRETIREARELMSRKIFKEGEEVADISVAVAEDVFARAERVVETFEKVERKR